MPSFVQLLVTVRTEKRSNYDSHDDGEHTPLQRPSLDHQDGEGCVATLLSLLHSTRLDVDSGDAAFGEPGQHRRLPIWWEDVASYCRNAIAVGFVTESETDFSALAMDHLCLLSGGNFLYISTVLEDIRKRRLNWDSVLHELQPGLKYLLSRHLNAARLDANPALLLAVEVIMAATSGDAGDYGLTTDGSGDGGGVSSACIVEAVRTMLPETVAASLSVGEIERLLRTIPKRFLSCKKEEESQKLGKDGHDCEHEDGDRSTSSPRHRWRLSHESVGRWLSSNGRNTDDSGILRRKVSILRGHQMLAARLAHRLAAVPIRTSLAQWMDQESGTTRFSPLSCIDPAEIVQLAVHVGAVDALRAAAKPVNTDGIHGSSVSSSSIHTGGNGDEVAIGGRAVLAALGARVLTMRKGDTAQTALHICALTSAQDEVCHTHDRYFVLARISRVYDVMHGRRSWLLPRRCCSTHCDFNRQLRRITLLFAVAEAV